MNSVMSSPPLSIAPPAPAPGQFAQGKRNQEQGKAFRGWNFGFLARLGGVLTFCLLLSACTSVESRRKPSGQRVSVKKQQSETWVPQLGRVTLVDEPAQFVLLDIGTAPAPSSGTTLRSYSTQGPTAELEVSRFQKRPFLIADIRNGHPQLGDRVFLTQGAQGASPVKGSESSEPPSEAAEERSQKAGENPEQRRERGDRR